MKKSGTLTSVILWSVISAAFIGPGTVTTAASAGSSFHLDLLWAVTFATLGCIILQEVSARLAIISGLTMGQALTKKYGEKQGAWMKYLLGGPVILGCAAYEAGNILGAISGLNLMTSANAIVLTTIITLVAAAILWTDKRSAIGWLMTLLVTMMGVAFFALAWKVPYSFKEYLESSVIPKLPEGSEMLTLGLVGTTIVPYNLFLGAGISKGQTVPLMRIGLAISVMIGGLITAAILIAGTSVQSFSNFNELADALGTRLGPMGSYALGIGLFAAGFSSAITSPYAASVIASSVFEWSNQGKRWVWILVLLTGFTFGVSGVKPIPIILMVQALNGLVLPLLTAYLILLINDHAIIPPKRRHPRMYDFVLILLFGCVLFMGLNSIDKSISAAIGIPSGHFQVQLLITLSLSGLVIFKLFRKNATDVSGG